MQDDEVLDAGGSNDEGHPEALSSGTFIHFIGVCEVLGGLGMVLPGMLRIKPGLTPLAAAGLVIIMIGATVLTIPQGVAMAVFPLVIGVLAAFVAYGRWRSEKLENIS